MRVQNERGSLLVIALFVMVVILLLSAAFVVSGLSQLTSALVVPGQQVGHSRLVGGSPPSALWRRTVL